MALISCVKEGLFCSSGGGVSLGVIGTSGGEEVERFYPCRGNSFVGIGTGGVGSESMG